MRQDPVQLIGDWADINTHTFNTDGLKGLSVKIKDAFNGLGEKIEEVSLPPFETVDAKGEIEKKSLAPCLKVTQRPSAKKQALLVIHSDTVYPQNGSFQKSSREDKVLKGPGVADAKGGLVVLLKSLEAFEQTPSAKKIGWQVIINTDEEIGSPSSTDLLMKTAQQCHIGFVFEPCLPDGNLIGARKGSGNFTLVCRGQSAHAGRNPQEGKSAINALAKVIVKISALNESRRGLTINCGHVEGGSAVNVVADLAIVRFNIRMQQPADQEFCEEKIKAIINEISKSDHVQMKLHGGFSAPPRPFEGKTKKLGQYVQACAKELGLSIDFKPSGGVCDGNRLCAAGLPTIDTMGVRGENIHSDKECLFIDSIDERIKLTTLCLTKWANDEWDL